MESRDYLGYIKFDGPGIREGMLDAKKAAHTLLCLDDALRLLVGQQQGELKDLDYEIPVKIEEGSWEAWVPLALGGWVAEKLKHQPNNDLAIGAPNLGSDLAERFRDALIRLQWFIKIGNHIGDVFQKRFPEASVDIQKQEIILPNAYGKKLHIPKYYFDAYENMPPKILRRAAEGIDSNKSLVVGAMIDGEIKEEMINRSQKHIFTLNDDDIETDLFPDLIHGMSVEFEGMVTRGNATTNTIGFRYREHILTCEPDSGSITRYKSALFSKCKIFGNIDRTNGLTHDAKKPRIVFYDLQQLDKGDDGESLSMDA